MSAILNLSIDLSKVDKSKLVDGKYLNTQVFINDETKYGNNVSMAYSQSKEQREAKEPKQYIANGKVVYVNNGIVVAEKEVENVANEPKKDDSLPF
jgi:hypothetical protein